MPSPVLTVIVVTWNAAKPLESCLRALEAERKFVPLELFIVDNASIDDSTKIARQVAPWSRLIENHNNRGFAAANNQALAQAQGRYIALLNPDTEALDRALGKLVGYLDRHPDVGAVGPMILTSTGEVDFRCARRFPTLWTEFCEISGLTRRFPQHRLFSGASIGHWDHMGPREVDTLSGACIVIRREAIDQVGFLDQDFFMYYEDTELCFRLKQAGWRIMYWPEAQVRHLGGYSTAQVRDIMGVESLRSANLMFRKCYGTGSAAIHRLMVVTVTLSKLAFFAANWLTALERDRRTQSRNKLVLHHQVLRWALGSQ